MCYLYQLLDFGSSFDSTCNMDLKPRLDDETCFMKLVSLKFLFHRTCRAT